MVVKDFLKTPFPAGCFTGFLFLEILKVCPSRSAQHGMERDCERYSRPAVFFLVLFGINLYSEKTPRVVFLKGFFSKHFCGILRYVGQAKF